MQTAHTLGMRQSLLPNKRHTQFPEAQHAFINPVQSPGRTPRTLVRCIRAYMASVPPIRKLVPQARGWIESALPFGLAVGVRPPPPGASIVIMEPSNSSSNYRPGEPLRKWDASSPMARHDINLMMLKANASESLLRLIRNEQLTDQDQIVFGKLNSWCVLDCYEPLVLLVDHPRIASEHIDFLTLHVKEFSNK